MTSRNHGEKTVGLQLQISTYSMKYTLGSNFYVFNQDPIMATMTTTTLTKPRLRYAIRRQRSPPFPFNIKYVQRKEIHTLLNTFSNSLVSTFASLVILSFQCPPTLLMSPPFSSIFISDH